MTFIKKITRTLAFKICLIGLIGFGLSVPLSIMASLTSERQSYSNDAIQEVIAKWGDTPQLYGPFITYQSVPEDKLLATPLARYAKDFTRLPTYLDISGKMNVVKLKRGLFKVPVYKSKIDFSGKFQDLKRVKNDDDIVLWNNAKLVFLVQDLKSLKDVVRLTASNSKNEIPFRLGKAYRNYNTIEVPLRGLITKAQLEQTNEIKEEETKLEKPKKRKRKLSKRQLKKLEEAKRKREKEIYDRKLKVEKEKHALSLPKLDFKFTLNIHGSKNLFFLPGGDTTNVKLSSDWPHPKFTGDFLPTSREVSKDGFTAEWNIPLFSRGLGETFHHQALYLRSVKAGVSLFEPTNVYVLNDRSLKYALISIAIVFLTVFIIELYAKQSVHWVQYMFVGFALVVFYFLLLGISEHFGFERAYIAASAATSLLIGAYIASVTGRFLRGLFVIVTLSILYGSLYMLLNATEYAMLTGSISVFFLLAVTMFATRNVDWSNATLGQEERAEM